MLSPALGTVGRTSPSRGVSDGLQRCATHDAGTRRPLCLTRPRSVQQARGLLQFRLGKQLCRPRIGRFQPHRQ